MPPVEFTPIVENEVVVVAEIRRHPIRADAGRSA